MKIFISWAEERAKKIAEILHAWLPRVIQTVEPLLPQNIEKGSRWALDLASTLHDTNFGIICLTEENKGAPWIHYEAGALSKLDNAHVCTYLFGLGQSDVTGPLAQFQHTSASDKEDTEKLVRSINAAMQKPLDPGLLKDAFEMRWPQLQEMLGKIGDAKPAEPARDKLERMVEEVLDLTRAAARARAEPTDAGKILSEINSNVFLEWVFRMAQAAQKRQSENPPVGHFGP